MADIHIVREHALGLEQARKLAFRWAEVAEKKLEMDCTYAEGKSSDVVSFKRPGASGELKVTKDRFELDARLGLLLGMFKSRIEGEIVKNLDQLLNEEDPLNAFEQGLQKHETKSAARHAPRKPAAKAAKPPAARKAK
ncbi:MAG TPA: polyhydroxyalkanoic acid system family protein [Ramlibacter sp.]|nr:polyhydroxyalkanoic acid system family protein [Ramlibacter sp.]